MQRSNIVRVRLLAALVLVCAAPLAQGAPPAARAANEAVQVRAAGDLLREVRAGLRGSGAADLPVPPANEPQYNSTGYPSVLMTADEQNTFVKNNLGPAFAGANIGAKILIYDHNWNDAGGPNVEKSTPLSSRSPINVRRTSWGKGAPRHLPQPAFVAGTALLGR